MNKFNKYFKSIKKDIFKGFSRIYWYTNTSIKYHFLTTKFNFKTKITKNYGVSVFLPSKNRSNKFKDMLSSLIKYKSQNNNIELLILFDEDEIELDSYLKIIDKYKLMINIFYFRKNFKTTSERVNYLASKCNFDIILSIADDAKFCLENWDKIIRTEFSKIDIQKPFSLWLRSDDIKYEYFHSNFPVINKSWYKKLGYHSPEKYFPHWWSDNWICDLGKKSGKFIVSKEVFFKHLNQINMRDDLYYENEKNRDSKKDYETWLKSETVRKKEAKKLI